MIGLFLAITFLFSVGGLYALVRSLSAKDPDSQRRNAAVIFQDKGTGHIEDPAGTASDHQALQAVMAGEPRSGETGMTADERTALDQSSRAPALAFLYGGLLWLLVASV